MASTRPHTMYPDWPQSAADLVPLPRCDGPKLKPFDFQGPQSIEFLDYLGSGLHSHVFKVAIRDQTYALKLFRFVSDESWLSPWEGTYDWKDRELMSAFYDYSEPFSCECRAYGRLQEAGYEKHAISCFGYVLLDEKHEEEIYTRFKERDITFEADENCTADPSVIFRTRFLGKGDRPPPIRGIVKQFGQTCPDEDYNTKMCRQLLADVKQLQLLGIFHLDLAVRQLVDGKIADFSLAITVPHYFTTPELNPRLTPEIRSIMEREVFALSMGDFLEIDYIALWWNYEHGEQQGREITAYAYPGGGGSPPMRPYRLRNRAFGERVYTLVDPRQYDRRMRGKAVRNTKWVYDCGDDAAWAEKLRGGRKDYRGARQPHECRARWYYEDGLLFRKIHPIEDYWKGLISRRPRPGIDD